MFDETDLAHQQRLKCAFDPDGLLNPGKVFPQLHRCAELGRLHVHAGRCRSPICRGSDPRYRHCEERQRRGDLDPVEDGRHEIASLRSQ